jgi:hypothetical protein
VAEPSPLPLSDRGLASRRLLVAIIRRSVLDFAVYRDTTEAEPKKFKLWSEAAAWLFDDLATLRSPVGGYTFMGICAYLDLDPAAIRRKTLELTPADIKRFNSGDL